LNAVAALSKVAPREVPRATGLLRQFLRASFDQQERVLVSLEEELALVGAYLEIESLRLGDRLKVEQAIDPGLLKVLMPPFSFQPLVENAIQHGLQSSPRAGRLQLAVRPTGPWLEMSVSDSQNQCRAQTLQHWSHADLRDSLESRGRMRREEEDQAAPQQRYSQSQKESSERVLRQLRPPVVQQPSEQTTAQHGSCDGA
jgi:LytS/YehU family sensor histidine kinase